MSLVHQLLRIPMVDGAIKPIRDRRVIRRWMESGRPVPAPHAVKVAAVWMLADIHNLHVLVETGTYYGKMIRALAPRFSAIHSIELSPHLARVARNEFAKYPHVQIVEGDSAECLPRLLSGLEQPALFWLDAHYCSGESARGASDTPISAEIEAILRSAPRGSVLLVDDARDFIGKNGYPELRVFVDQLAAHTQLPVTVFDDIIYAVL